MPGLMPRQRASLDAAVLAFIRANRGSRTMDLLKAPEILKALKGLPSVKEDFRYLDNSLQRLRKAKKIEASSNRWNVVERPFERT